MYDFHASDLGTSVLLNSKYYWQNEEAECCIIVPDDVNDDITNPALLYFVQVSPGANIICTDNSNPDAALIKASSGKFTITAKMFPRPLGICLRPENCPQILEGVLSLIDNNSWSFPRAKSEKPYISKMQAILLESNFKTMVTAPDDGTCVYTSVSKAGSMLAERLKLDTEVFSVNHYDMVSNTQDDDRIEVEYLGDTNLSGRKVIIIDDLLSSGRTANAVIGKALELGATQVCFFALYRTIASQEVDLITSDKVMIQTYLPISNAYWTYGRGFDLTDEESRLLPDVYAATKHWVWEKDSDVDALIKFFSGRYTLEDYRK